MTYIEDMLRDEDEEEEDPALLRARAGGPGWPYPLAVTPQLLPGRTRKCGFWVSPMVRDSMRYIVDTNQITPGASWTHNPAQDQVPEDTLLVVVSPRDAEHIRKALATYPLSPNPAFLAARIIDFQCKEDPTLASRMRWWKR